MYDKIVMYMYYGLNSVQTWTEQIVMYRQRRTRYGHGKQ
jgi:hypothetical protein